MGRGLWGLGWLACQPGMPVEMVGMPGAWHVSVGSRLVTTGRVMTRISAGWIGGDLEHAVGHFRHDGGAGPANPEEGGVIGHDP